MAPHDVEKDIEHLKARFKEQPKSLLFARLADAYRKAGDVVSAIELCTNGITVFPTYTTAQILLGRCYLEQQKYNEAIDAFTTVCRLDRRNQVAMKMLADVFAKQGEEGEQKAGDLYALLLAMDPLNTTLKHNSSQYPSSGTKDLYTILGSNGSTAEHSAGFAAPENEDVAAFSSEQESAPNGFSTIPPVASIDSFDDLLPVNTPNPVQGDVSGGDISDRMSALFGEQTAESPVVSSFANMPAKEPSGQDDPFLPALSGDPLQVASDISGNEVSKRIDELFNEQEPSGSGSFSDTFLDLSLPDDADAGAPDFALPNVAGEELGERSSFIDTSDTARSAAFPSESIDLSRFDEELDLQTGGADDADFGGLLENIDSRSSDRGGDDSVAEKALSRMNLDSVAGSDVSSRLEELFGEIDQEPLNGQVTKAYLSPVADDEEIVAPPQETGDLSVATLDELSFGVDESAVHTIDVEQGGATETNAAAFFAGDSSVSGDDVSSRLGELFGDDSSSAENVHGKSNRLPDSDADLQLLIDTGEAVAALSFDAESSLSSDALPEAPTVAGSDDDSTDWSDVNDDSGSMALVPELEGTETIQTQPVTPENTATVSGNDIVERLGELFAETPPLVVVPDAMDELVAPEEPDRFDRYNQVTELHLPAIDDDNGLPPDAAEDMQSTMAPETARTDYAGAPSWVETDSVQGISGGEISDRLSEMFAHGEPFPADLSDSESGEIDEYTQFDLAIEPEMSELIDTNESVGDNDNGVSFGTGSALDPEFFDVGNLDAAVVSEGSNLRNQQQERERSLEPDAFQGTGMRPELPAEKMYEPVPTARQPVAEGSFFATEFEETLQFDSALLEQMLNPVHPEEHFEVALPNSQPLVAHDSANPQDLTAFDNRSDGTAPPLPGRMPEEEDLDDLAQGTIVGDDDDAGYNSDRTEDAHAKLPLIDDYEQEARSSEALKTQKPDLILDFSEDQELTVDAYGEPLSRREYPVDKKPLLDESDVNEQGRVPDDPVGSFLDENFSPPASQAATPDESKMHRAVADYTTITNVPQGSLTNLIAEADEAVSHHDDGLGGGSTPVVSGADVAARLEEFFSSHDIMALSSDRDLLVDEESDETSDEGVADFYTVTGEDAAVDGSAELLRDEIEAIGFDAQLIDEDVPDAAMVDEPAAVVLDTGTNIDDEVLPDVELFEEPLPYSARDSEPTSPDERDKNFSVPDHVLTPTS